MQLLESECVTTTVNNMHPQLRERLVVVEYSNLVQLTCIASRVEQYIVDKEQRKSSCVRPQGPQMISVIDYNSSEEDV